MSKQGVEQEFATDDAAAQRTPPFDQPATLTIDEAYRLYWRELVRYLRARFGPTQPDPEDIAQSAFAALAAIDIGSLSNPRSYLFTIACNLTIDHRRQVIRHNSLHQDPCLQTRIGAPADISPERILLGRERILQFRKALTDMPKMRRRIFLLVRVEGQSPRKVAAQFGISESAVYKHVARALHDCAAMVMQDDY